MLRIRQARQAAFDQSARLASARTGFDQHIAIGQHRALLGRSKLAHRHRL